jgi:hypothetical protein
MLLDLFEALSPYIVTAGSAALHQTVMHIEPLRGSWVTYISHLFASTYLRNWLFYNNFSYYGEH